MSYEYNGNTLEANDNGYLVNHEDWNEEVAGIIAAAEGITLSEKAWDVINYL
ncbi:MAG: TusE/DsrC/DsvC family sulfur relay protein, partial [Sedimenticola sp.]|nr:TusE/DsrC/DsvC family sulfur relay protein [Sedimenticola sp.]